MSLSAGMEHLSDAKLADAWHRANRRLADFSAQRAQDVALSQEQTLSERAILGAIHQIERETARRALQRQLADHAKCVS